ncbi:CLAVATA3/ESR (CLE)-related protein [Trema orientale]|uniref:CLAVATA3/ESR (CLE)-related protein n=1 Tax=Trema orientale TaxID=63057 RepID=A0A2P5D169_TREOI|nr:CLAVATA3/ESR (CLE)-related protein [Trema orientale]
MVFATQRVLILLICIGLLSFQPDKVSGLRSIDIAVREQKEESHLFLQIRRFLKVVKEEEKLNSETKSASQNNKFDPNQSSKRKVRRGSDPIHNRC